LERRPSGVALSITSESGEPCRVDREAGRRARHALVSGDVFRHVAASRCCSNLTHLLFLVVTTGQVRPPNFLGWLSACGQSSAAELFTVRPRLLAFLLED
jgi:hypothetical protein